MAAMSLSHMVFTTHAGAHSREVATHNLRSACPRVHTQLGQTGSTTNTQVKLSPKPSTSTSRAVGLQRPCEVMCTAFTLRAPLRSRRYLELYEPSAPRLRIVEDDESQYKLVFAVPGVGADGVTLSVSDDGLLKVEAKSKTGQDVLQRTIQLAHDALTTEDAVKAVCVDGLLEVIIKKKQPPAAISVPVGAGEPPETDELYMVTKKIPGISAAEVTATLKPLRNSGCSTQSYELVISATSARGYGDYHFRQSLPEDINPEDATAFCSNGLLHVRVPRREPIRVTVPVASSIETSAEEEQLQLSQFKVPGYSAKQVSVRAMAGVLRIKFQRTAEEQVERLVVIPEEVDLDCIRAECVDGLLTVKVPKSALRGAETRQVLVSAERS